VFLFTQTWPEDLAAAIAAESGGGATVLGAAVLAAGAAVVAGLAAGAGAAAGAGVVAGLAAGAGVVVFAGVAARVVLFAAGAAVVVVAAAFAFFLEVFVLEEVVEPVAGVVVVGVVCARTIPVQSSVLRASTCSDFMFRSNPFQFLFVDLYGAAIWDDCLERLQEPPVVSHMRCKHRQVRTADENPDAAKSFANNLKQPRPPGALIAGTRWADPTVCPNSPVSRSSAPASDRVTMPQR
jgi:hypothetical protein